MSGFAGEFTMGRAPDRDAVERMADTMVGRGPDASGFWTDGQFAAACRRLSVIDTSDIANQPMLDYENGATIVFDGAIYNHAALRQELGKEGFSFHTGSDAEVVLKAHDHWGPRCIDSFVGEFSYVLFEHYSNRVFMARDRLGIKPLYLAEVDGALRFASTIPALLAGGGIDTELDPVALHHYLTWGAVPAPRTIFKGVSKLEPGTSLIVTPDGRRTRENYWRPSYERHHRYLDWKLDGWAEEFRYELYTALERRMVADVPVAISLDGGLEPRLFMPFLADGEHKGLVGFSASENEAGAELAKRFENEHNTIEVTEELVRESVQSAVAAMSEPVADPDAVAWNVFAKGVAASHKVIQTAAGAHELFGGDPRYAAIAADERPTADAYAAHTFDRTDAEIGEALQPAYRLQEDPSRALLDWHLSLPGTGERLDRALHFDIDVLLPAGRLSLLDSVTASAGVEARSPYLDYELVELLATCPPAVKGADGGSAILESAAQGFVPDDLIGAPGTAPLPAFPGSDGLSQPVVAEALTAASKRGVFAPGYIERLLASPEADLTPRGGSKLWSIALLELWLQANGL